MAKNAGRLAGLAALAGAAYMMSKDKDKGVTDTGDETSRLLARSPAPEKSAGEKAMADTNSSVLTALQKPSNIREEAISAANDSSATAMPVKPRSSITSTKIPPVPASRKILSQEEGMKNYKPRYTPSAMAPKTTEGASYQKKPYMPEDVDMGRKKGGAIKMASGGMTASRRADGIATKGKTRGKIC